MAVVLVDLVVMCAALALPWLPWAITLTQRVAARLGIVAQTAIDCAAQLKVVSLEFDSGSKEGETAGELNGEVFVTSQMLQEAEAVTTAAG